DCFLLFRATVKEADVM
ncbi:hypothetical protein A2U01_0069873, partial [Trifolium medium]|nr:hypothetical protein [Trifolium medium]